MKGTKKVMVQKSKYIKVALGIVIAAFISICLSAFLTHFIVTNKLDYGSINIYTYAILLISSMVGIKIMLGKDSCPVYGGIIALGFWLTTIVASLVMNRKVEHFLPGTIAIIIGYGISVLTRKKGKKRYYQKRRYS